MKYKNTQKAIVIIGDRESVQPFGITRDFSPKDIDSMPGIDAAIRRGYLIPHEGPDEPAPAPVSPRAAQWHTDMSSGTTVKKQIPGGGIVEYITSDTDGADAVVMSDPDTVTSLEGKRSSDYIEEGVSANAYTKKNRTASEAFDAEIDAENDGADFDDEDTLAENESERDNILDVDDEIAKDTSQMFAKNAGAKGGAQPHDVRSLVEQSVASALTDVSKATQPDYDDAELQNGAPAKIVEFLKQNFSAKKWAIAKESDMDFLRGVVNVTKSENVRTLAEQRLTELERAVK